MGNKADALDRLDIQFRWGDYGFRVLRCHLAEFHPGWTIPFHKHSEYEFHFIPRGQGSVIIEDRKHFLHEGVFYLTGPGVIHQQEADETDGMDELCLHIDIIPLPEQESADWGAEWERSEAEHCIQSLRSFPLHPCPDQYNAMSCFLTAYRALETGDPGAYTAIKGAVIQILLRSARVTDANVRSTELPSRDLGAHRFQMAVQYIQDNYANPLTLQEVAERLHISGRQLQRIFQEHSSESFSSYLEDFRLTRVCAALAEGQKTIRQIAEKTGFSSSNYLYSVFRKKKGMTPSQYRVLHE
jgi:AraC-like DNA-binding protein